MKLDYKILWIEDDDSWRISITSAIKKHIKDKGFNPIIETPSKDELSNISNESFKDFDLLLVDHDLKSMSKDNGDILIQKIRNQKLPIRIHRKQKKPKRKQLKIKIQKIKLFQTDSRCQTVNKCQTDNRCQTVNKDLTDSRC